MADITLRVNGATCAGSPEARKTLADRSEEHTSELQSP